MLNILVVEDRPDEALPLCHFLLRSGYRVNVAIDGADALEKEIADPPDIILLDLGLPKLDGFEVAQATRHVAWKRRPLIVAITGHDEPEYRKRATAAGVDLFFPKPIDPQALHVALCRFEAAANCAPAHH
jgi:DNA-binding response OmpR family regulator